MRDSRSLSNLRRTMERHLRPGETLIWVGQPDPACFAREVRRAYLLLLGLSAVLAGGAVYAAYSSHSALMAFWALPLIAGLLVYVLVAAPWRYPERVLRTIYAITDRRALVHEGFGWSLLWLEVLPDLYDPLWSFDPGQIRARRRLRRYPGRIDLVFDGERHCYMTGRGQLRDWVQVGFLGLANVDEIDELLEQQFFLMDVSSS
jgi:hypothetical protein